MAKGAPDWRKVFFIRALDESGNVHDVQVDSSGRLVMLPYGDTGSDYVPLRVAADGTLYALLQGTDGEDLKTILTDEDGRLLTVIHDPTSGNNAAITDDGYLSSLLMGQADVRRELLLWYPFREVEEDQISDASGNGHNGLSYVGGAAGAVYCDGAVDAGIQLDGVSDYIDVGTDSIFDFTTEDHTVEFWIKPASGHARGYITARINGATSGWGIVLQDTNYLRYYTVPAGPVQFLEATTPLIDDEWSHVVVVKTSGYIWFYINGVDCTPTPNTIDDTASYAGNLYIGRYIAGVYQFEGALDEIRIYTRLLTPGEALWRYQRTYVTYNSRYRPLAVDAEGRLEVRVEQFGYRKQVLDGYTWIVTGGGNKNQVSAAVPAGKLWVITRAYTAIDSTAANSLDIGIVTPADNYIVAWKNAAGAVWDCLCESELILAPGQYLNFGCGHNATTYIFKYVINGYELDYPY
jgi:hypothetical protein